MNSRGDLGSLDGGEDLKQKTTFERLSEANKDLTKHPWILYKTFGFMSRTFFAVTLVVILGMMAAFLIFTPGISSNLAVEQEALTTLSVAVIINLYALNMAFTTKTSYMNLGIESLMMGWLLLLNYYLGNVNTLIVFNNYYPLLFIFAVMALASEFVAMLICKLKGQDITWYWGVITGTNLKEQPFFGR